MRLGFFIDRNTHHKVLAPVIDEALRRGHEVICFHDYSQPKDGMKGYLFPSIEDAPAFYYGTPNFVPCFNHESLAQKAGEFDVDVIVTLMFVPPYLKIKQKLNKGIKWISFQHSTDTLYHTNLLPSPDLYFFYSRRWFDWAVDFFRLQKNFSDNVISDFRSLAEEKVRFVGFTELDQKSLISSEKVREEWDIPQEKPVVLFLPFPFEGKIDNFWVPYIYGMNNPAIQLPLALFSGRRYSYTRQILNGENDYNLCRSIRKFCDRNGAYLIVKSRKKHPVRKYLRLMADKVLYDESYYPSDILKCLSISGLCINFLSTSVTEAAPMGVPNLAIAPDPRDYIRLQDFAWKFFREKGWLLFNYPEVSSVWSIPQVIDNLPKFYIEDFAMEPTEQQRYIKQFLFANDGKASSRALDEIEKLEK